MTETVRVVHVHKYRRPPRFTVGKVLRAGWRMVPFSGVIQNVVVAVAVLAAYVMFWPGDDVPYVPGVSCETEQPASGVRGVAYALGDQARRINTNPPTIRDVRGALLDGAEWAGGAVGEFERALNGDGPTMEALDPEPEPESLPVADCTPCPGTEATPVVGADAKGIRVATDAALAAGWEGEDAVVAVAVSGAESDYNPDAQNPSSSAKGLWQTMMSYHAPKYGPGESWDDPFANARVAHQIWADAGGWSPWTVHTSGAYQAHMAEARHAVAAAAGSTPVTHTASISGAADCGTGPLLKATTNRYDLPGVKPWVDDAAEILGTKYDVDVVGGVRNDPGSDHHTGLALDFMTTPEVGDKLAADAVKHATALGVTYVIWEQRIWSVARASEGWRMMEDRGSPTANHMDHPHLSFTATPPPAGTLPVTHTTSSDGGLSVGSYNLQVSRPVGTVVREVSRLMRTRDLDVLAVQEAAHYTPALARRLRGVDVVWDGTDASSRDSAVIVRHGLETTDPLLHRLGGDGWPAWNGTGRHHPRSAVSVDVEGVRVVSVHLPPLGGPIASRADQRRAYRTNIRALANVGAGAGPLLMVGDWNASPATPGPWSPAALARGLGATIHGDGIDYAMTRDAQVSGVRRFRFGGSDHDPVRFTVALVSAA